MEFVVYILYSEKFDKTYVGYTSSIIQRYYSHNMLATKGHTIKFRPWIVTYIEVFESKTDAIKKEKWFKSGIGRNYLNELKKNNFSLK